MGMDMSILLGVDTGGTYTDAVLIKDEETVIASAKALTTRDDLAVGVGNAVQTVLSQSGITPSDIVMTSLSTTLATNALVEGKGGKVCLVFIGFSPKDIARQGLDDALKGDPVIILNGGHDHTGSEVSPLETDALIAELDKLDGVSGFAVAGQFATRNAAHENAVRDIIREKTAVPVSCSHELSAKLGGPKRAMTAVLNARLIGMIDHLIGATEGYFKHIGINAQMMVVRGDGALISADQAREKPIETILSGPAASIVGARWLTDETDAMVSDIGGTTTDVAILRNGRPMIDPDGAMVGGLRTMVEAVAMRTFGLGGDSQVHLSREGLSGDITLGPRRVMPVSLLAMTHKEMVHNALDSALGDERGQEFAAQFLVPMAQNALGLSERDQVVFDRISAGALPMAAAVKTRIDLGSIERLLERGLVMQAGITPSDASHVLGRVDVWDQSAAGKALSVFGRMRTGAGEMLADDPHVLALLIINQLTEQTAEVLLETAFGDEDIDGNPRDLARHALVKSGMEHHRGVVSLDVGLNLPIVGLGASAQAYYGAVGERLNARTVLPEHGGVANAIGAVVGQITMRETGLIEGVGDGAWRVFMDDGPVNYSEQDAAYQALRDVLGAQVTKQAQQAGAADIRLRFEEDVQEATIEGRTVFVKGSVLAIASGRPRIAE
jgi:N-methylhydantoinase A/oxoprolinase/acetone carboxylase beta subunit